MLTLPRKYFYSVEDFHNRGKTYCVIDDIKFDFFEISDHCFVEKSVGAVMVIYFIKQAFIALAVLIAVSKAADVVSFY